MGFVCTHEGVRARVIRRAEAMSLPAEMNGREPSAVVDAEHSPVSSLRKSEPQPSPTTLGRRTKTTAPCMSAAVCLSLSCLSFVVPSLGYAWTESAGTGGTGGAREFQATEPHARLQRGRGVGWAQRRRRGTRRARDGRPGWASRCRGRRRGTRSPSEHESLA